MADLLEHIIVNYRWIFVMFLLPVSFLYDIYFYARNVLIFKLKSAPKKHVEKVGKIQAQIRDWRDQGSKKLMCTARPGNVKKFEVFLALAIVINSDSYTARNILLISSSKATVTLIANIVVM